MAEESLLRELKVKRGSIKRQLTRLKKYLDKLNKENIDITQIETRLVTYQPLNTEFENIQIQIELASENGDVEEQERQEFEDSYFNAISRLKTLIKNHSIRHSTSQGTNNVSNENREQATSAISGINTLNSIRLPKLELPTFDGSYDKYLFFRDTFESVINQNTSISPAQKFQYLRSVLKGEARGLVESLEISDSNYAIAWKLIQDRYDDEKQIINNHVQALFNLPSVHKESHKAVRQLTDGFSKHLRALQVLKQPVSSWDTLIVFLIVNKLDDETKRAWEAENSKLKSVAKLSELTEFLNERCKFLEKVGNKPISKITGQREKVKVFNNVVTESPRCYSCKGDHALYSCAHFLNLDPSARFEEVKRIKICSNCFRKGHIFFNCRAPPGCTKCNKRHNTLLHGDANNVNTANKDNVSRALNSRPNEQNQDSETPQSIIAKTASFVHSRAILATAIIKIKDDLGNFRPCKALLDCGSQSNFISEALINKLRLKKNEINYVSVAGINNVASKVTHKTEVTIRSNQNSFESDIQCLILPKIAEITPSHTLENLCIPKNIKLADPNFNSYSDIDILLGAGIFWGLICVGQIKLGKDMPLIQKTQLGWVITGPIPQNQQTNVLCNLNNTVLHKQLERFWTIEEYSDHKALNVEEMVFEKHFVSTSKRDENGRFIVDIPMKYPLSKLGQSRLGAVKRLYQMERKFAKNLELKENYSQFMSEYMELGHMTKLDRYDDVNSFYLPHHIINKPDSTSTTYRVVFDGSAKSSSGYSINDLQLTGANIQDDLFSIVMRFRKHNIVLTGDVTKMYRQITVNKAQRSLQRILWRSHPEKEVQCYELNTVTYGLASSSFIAIRCLHQLANDYAKIYPAASDIIKRDFYVDDLLTGGKNITEVKELQRQVTEILNSGGFPLNKWASNDPSILKEIASLNPNAIINLGDNHNSKILGLYWKTQSDTLRFSIKTDDVKAKATKRSILSMISQIYDPLGLLSPVVIIAKIVLQRLWETKLSWDESIPQGIHSIWIKFYDQLSSINDVEFQRQAICKNATSIELHGFADASESAYGAVFYIKSRDNEGISHVRILCSKTRVAPLKSVTIPRLELCAALLLAQLYAKIERKFDIRFEKCYFWSDSTIVLAWIRSSSRDWKVFVSNRIAEIQNLTKIKNWQHINTAENPADLLTRGIEPSLFKTSKLWFSGPPWLLKDATEWPHKMCNLDVFDVECVGERRQPQTCLIVSEETIDLADRYSSLSKLQRVVAYCRRFVKNASATREQRQFGPLTVANLNEALIKLVRAHQTIFFEKELKELKRKGGVEKGSRIVALNPFLDDCGILRVGGRLNYTDYSYDKKFPMLLDSRSNFTKLVVKNQHLKSLHAGQQATLAVIRERYWILSGRQLVKKVIRECLPCFRFSKNNSDYLMAALPKSRLTPTRSFLNCGLDYAGPISMRDSKARKFKVTKCYICLFICFSTKASHIELVSDLSTEAFLAALRRFVARRGKPSNLYSDNGTNFVGAKRELKRFLNDKTNEFQDALHQENINWHMIPPRSPHFGGLWEAGIKSIKHHLKRVLGNAILTFEELITILTQIEACLNSRPLCPLSNDPSDLYPLTPAHFLIGDSLAAVPDQNLIEVKENRLARFQRCQQILQHFWTRWSKEYVSEMQVRTKWKQSREELLKPDALVLIKEDNTPPLRWRIGRVIQLHSGKDAVNRVATIRTSDGTYKRPAVKLCVLPSA